MPPVQAVILCGGLGTRLAEETEVRPKPMVEIGGKPILWHIMKLYSHYGVTDFVLCLGYKGDVIRDYFLNYGSMHSDVAVNIGERRVEHLDAFHDEANWRVVLAETGQLTPTGGRLHRIAKYIEGDEFMATYGDGVADVNLNELLAFHRKQGKLATVTGVRPATRFGELRLRGDLAYEFREKPQLEEGWINGGFFVYRRDALKYLRPDSILEREPLEQLARDGELAVFRHPGYWRPMDTMRERRALEEEWATGRPPWKVW
jgi:glucose-1-phosphate cytidylyltransferase